MYVCIYFYLFYLSVKHELNVHKSNQEHNKVTKHLLLLCQLWNSYWK